MKNTFIILFGICLILQLPSHCKSAEPAGSLTGSFTVYDGLGYRNKPDLTAFGMKELYIAYTAEIWSGVSSHDQPNEIAVRNVARKMRPKVPLVLDVEHWKLQGRDRQVEENIDKLIRLADWVHKENPDQKVGFFGLMPISNAYKELNYAKATLNLLGLPRIKEEYRELQADNSRLKRLASHVDFVCPVLYTFKNLNGAAYDKCWDTMAVNAIAEARQYGKPIYVFLWPQFFDHKERTGDRAFIPDTFWRHELELARNNKADGAIIWGSTTFRKAGWNGDDPWWKITREFVASIKK